MSASAGHEPRPDAISLVVEEDAMVKEHHVRGTPARTQAHSDISSAETYHNYLCTPHIPRVD
jgi:hypothetical protein